MVNRDDLLVLVDDAIAGLPEELRQARWLLKEREEFLAKARREAEDIIDAGRAQAERMVERTEVVREARRRAQQVIDDAEAQARALKHEAEDYIDQKSRRSRSCSTGPCKRCEGPGAAPGRRRSAGGRGGQRRRRGRVLRPGRRLTTR
jgi:F0F1-type ATP synthase membrane subunit b/b'